MSAMPEEILLLARELKREAEHVHGGRTYISGTLAGHPVVLVFSRMGKVAAAATAQHLIDIHRVSSIIFTGVAGALDPTLRIGDVVIARNLWQHDMDASPIFRRSKFPCSCQRFAADPIVSAALHRAALAYLEHDFVRDIDNAAAKNLGIAPPSSYRRHRQWRPLRRDRFRPRSRPPARADRLVRRDGSGAVAQVCHEQSVPLGVVRIISDSADERAPADFGRFVRDAASHYGIGIVRRFLESASGGSV